MNEVVKYIIPADLLADKKKAHGHYNKKIGRLYFCVPAALVDFAAQHIPERAGLLTVESPQFLWATKAREARLTGDYRWTAAQRDKLMHLGCMRLLPLIENLQRRHRDDEQILLSEVG